jgi:hypothetical protein
MKQVTQIKHSTTSTIAMRLRWGAFFVVLLFLAAHVIPRALGQRHTGAPSLNRSPTGLICTPGWSAGHDLLSVGVRLVGVYFPANGKFYAMGGRWFDFPPGSDFTHPFEYDPGSNTWTTKSATLSRQQGEQHGLRRA